MQKIFFNQADLARVFAALGVAGADVGAVDGVATHVVLAEAVAKNGQVHLPHVPHCVAICTSVNNTVKSVDDVEAVMSVNDRRVMSVQSTTSTLWWRQSVTLTHVMSLDGVIAVAPTE